MAAWFLLPAAMAAVKGVAGYMQAKNQPIAPARKHEAYKQKANTGYLRRYMADLRGRSADRARTELAMRPALRAIGAQQAKGQRQLAYQSAQQGLTGSGIEAQKQLALQQGTTQAVAGLGEKVLSQQLAQAQKMQAAKEGQRMKLAGEIGKQEAAVVEANRRAQFQTTQANIAEQQAYDQRVAQKDANVKNALIQGVAGVATSFAGGIGQHAMDKIAADKAELLRQKSEDFQWDLMNAQNQTSLDKLQGGGVAGKDMEYYQTGGVAQDDEYVEFLSGSQGYQQALQDYQVQQNEALAIQQEDKSKQFKQYNSKLAQIKDIESSRKTKTNTATGQITMAPLTRSQKNKIKKLKKETEVEVLQPEEVKPYQLTQADSSKIAKDYTSNLFRQGLVSAEGLHESFTNWKDQKYANLETAVDNRMTDFYEQASDPDQAVNSDEVFETLRNPNFMKSKNYKTYRTSLVNVLNKQQADIERQAGADKKVADERGTIKRELVQNVHSLAPFLKTATKIPAVTGKPATRTSEAVEATPASYDIQDNFEDVLAEMKYLIAADDGGIPDATYDEILYRVKQIVDELTIPLSQLQDISKEDRKKFSIYADTTTGAWQIEGGDAKFKRIMVEELTKNLSKAVMWDDNASVEGEDKDEGETFKSSTGIEIKVK